MALKVRTVARLVGAGHVGERLRAVRDGQAAVRAATLSSALGTGVLEALRAGRTTAELAADLAVTDHALLEAYLRTLEAARLVRTAGGRHRLARRGRAVLGDDVVRAAYEGFAGYHTGLYRDLALQLRGGPARDDVVRHGDVIARLSRALEPLVHDTLDEAVAATRPRRVLDVGCGDGANLVHMLRAAPSSSGTGIEVDPAAAALAERTLRAEGLEGRAHILKGDIRGLDPQQIGGPADLALLANVIYYVPVGERRELLRDIGALVAPGGTLLVVSTMADRSAFSRHFDLLLRAQSGEMSLPTPDDVTRDLRAAGLDNLRVRRLTRGDPLHAVTARRPS
ncbi:methyltransferase domain-containing protein [Georgenia yuyongxinii]|uniref:Methyltransferase domain-containing protein n=1 Tax=Georgenia yuyongxinii TaxID=2589797 RepID=A0A5B8C5L7_9MICO|nr:methyltransferase domain-containing protein [Georgenia yuyongxinii]